MKIGNDEIQWEIKFKDEQDYGKVQTFLSQFPVEDNFLFARTKVFWTDFLDDKVDMDRFMDFYKWTDNGKPNASKSEDGQYNTINKERIIDPNAVYFNALNDSIHVKSREEVYAQMYGRADSTVTTEGTTSKPVPRQPEYYGNAYFSMADDSGIIEYKGATFICDKNTNTLCLGDCSSETNCIRVSLSGGGFLLVNKDNIDELARALSMFSSEDVSRILKAIHGQNIAKQADMQDKMREDEVLLEMAESD